MRPTRTSLAVLCVAATLAGCGTDHTAAPAPAPGGVSAPSSTVSQDTSLLSPYGEPEPTGSDGGSAGGASDRGSVSDLSASSDGLAEAPFAAPGAAAPGSDTPTVPGTGPGALRAGFVDDNADFAAYQHYLDDYTGPARDVSVAGRQIVTVTDTAGLPLLGAQVSVGDSTVPSHVDGRALFFDVAAGDEVAVTYGEATGTGTLTANGATTVVVDAARVDASDLVVDLDLVLDTTGSMGDEIDRLNSSLADIATRLDELPSHPEVRYGLTVYRDHGDTYVFRTHDFTDLATFRDELATTTADGGGDYPEALDEAFHGSVNGPSWGQDTASVELMLLVSDASSHLGDKQGTATYVADLAGARERGIEVVPLAASGSDDSAEMEFRQMAQQTLGTFFFLTYGPDGAPGDGTTNHVSDYATGSLDDLIVEHVSSRLAAYDVAAGTQPTDDPTDGPTDGPTNGQSQAPTLPLPR
ncbi:hypothetical protein BH11ACT8_BH11ACT8_35890 [soil metagenome]